MSRLPRTLVRAALLCATLIAPAARAQWAVIDVQAVARLAQEVQTLQQALATAQAQLAQARQTLQSMSGTRGMERLLAGTARNYLPPDWSAVSGLGTGAAGQYGALAAAVSRLVAANTVLPGAALAAFTPGDRQRLIASRERIATDQAVFQSALSNASGRFAALQTLIDTIPTASDQKGILDLQARIDAENGMLQNEQIKLLVLAQALRAEGAAQRQRGREAVIAAQGQFATRFRPAP